MHILALGFSFLSLPSSYFATSFSTHHHYYRRHTQHLYALITACLLCKGNCRSLLSAKESSSLHSYVPSLCPCLSLKEMLPGRPRVNTIHKSLNTTHESANKSCRGQAGGLGGGKGRGNLSTSVAFVRLSDAQLPSPGWLPTWRRHAVMINSNLETCGTSTPTKMHVLTRTLTCDDDNINLVKQRQRRRR